MIALAPDIDRGFEANVPERCGSQPTGDGQLLGPCDIAPLINPALDIMKQRVDHARGNVAVRVEIGFGVKAGTGTSPLRSSAECEMSGRIGSNRDIRIALIIPLRVQTFQNDE